MYKVELVPIPARIQEKILKSLSDLNLNRNKLANDCLATIIALDQRSLVKRASGVAPYLLKTKQDRGYTKPCILKLRKDLVDYMVMQSWNKSGAINEALKLGLREIASGVRFAFNYQSGQRQHYRLTAAISDYSDDSRLQTITEPWNFDKCCINGEWQGAQICGFCARYSVRGRFCQYDLKPKTAQDYCSRFIESREGTNYICARCFLFDTKCKLGTEPNPQSHNCQAYYPAP